MYVTRGEVQVESLQISQDHFAGRDGVEACIMKKTRIGGYKVSIRPEFIGAYLAFSTNNIVSLDSSTPAICPWVLVLSI